MQKDSRELREVLSMSYQADSPFVAFSNVCGFCKGDIT